MSGFFLRCKQPDYGALKLLTSQIARRCVGWHRWPEIPRLGRTLNSAAEADCSDELRVTLAITSLAGKLPQSTATRAGTSQRASTPRLLRRCLASGADPSSVTGDATKQRCYQAFVMRTAMRERICVASQQQVA